MKSKELKEVSSYQNLFKWPKIATYFWAISCYFKFMEINLTRKSIHQKCQFEIKMTSAACQDLCSTIVISIHEPS